MSNKKTCGECKWFAGYYDWHGVCLADNRESYTTENSVACDKFFYHKRTNGDVIRQKSNEELVMILTGEGCKYCIYRGVNFKGFTVTCRYPDKTRIPDCNAGILAWFNAPADCVKQNGNHDTQPDLCKTDNTESEGKDE